MISYLLKILNPPVKHHNTFLYKKPHAAFLQVHYLAKTLFGFGRRLKHIKKSQSQSTKDFIPMNNLSITEFWIFLSFLHFCKTTFGRLLYFTSSAIDLDCRRLIYLLRSFSFRYEWRSFWDASVKLCFVLQ